MRTSESLFFDIRGLRYHLRHWQGDPARRMVLLHGWMDVSASFQFMVDALAQDWDVYAPDWRGYGLTDWGRSDCYGFTDYIADLDALLDRIQADAPVNLVGHSLGGNVAAIYAGVRPQRIAKLVNLDGLGMAPSDPVQAPRRYARWLDELRERPRLKPYDNFSALADRMQKGNPRLTRERAEFLARHWGYASEDGGVVLRSDPAHKIVNPMLYRYEEARACWGEVTAPVLWVDASESDYLKRAGLSEAQHAERRAAFRRLHYVTVAQAGHMLHHDRPEEVARLIEEFFLQIA
ncbi:MAG: alpha/beta hydrolase [Betaproteobacteria bacterium]|nr:alpha/beta hydrolase [Betaproteobacteria bacterium]